MTSTAIRRLRSADLGTAKMVATVTGFAAFVVLLARGARRDWFTGDTTDLVKGVQSIANCLTNGIFVHCSNHPIGTGHAYVSKFPLIAQVPAFLLHLCGLSDTAVINGLTWLNALAVAALIAGTLTWARRRGGLGLAVIAGVLLIPGMLLPYANQSFTEPLATVAFGALVLTSLRTDRPSRWLILAALVATDSKETAAPFVLLIGLAAIGLSRADLRGCKQSALRLIIGSAGGVILQAGLNVFRYGTLINHVYLAEPRATVSMIPSNALGMLVSPDAGVIWFWPGVAIGVATLVWAAIRPGGTTKPEARRVRTSSILGLLAFVATVGTLADWWAPFGWYAWGPRLLMPIGGAMLVLALPVIARSELSRFWLSRPGVLGLGLIASFTLAPNVGAVFTPGSIMAQVPPSARESAACAAAVPANPTDVPKPTQQQRDECLVLETWRLKDTPWQVTVYQSRHSPAYWLDLGLGWASIWLWLSVAAAESRRPKAPPVLSAP